MTLLVHKAEEDRSGLAARGPALSSVAELLLFAIDPARGGLLPRRRRRFRKALARAYRADRPGRDRPWTALVARRRATRELAQTGLIASRSLTSPRLRLADRALVMRRFRWLCGSLVGDESPAARELALALLLAWSGILHRRLTRHERRVAARRLRRLAREPLFPATMQVPLSGTLSEPEWVSALGRVAYESQENFVVDVISDFASGGFGEIDLGIYGWGGGEGGSGGGGEAGGGHGGGGDGGGGGGGGN